MNTQLIIAVSVALFLAPVMPLLAAEHPQPHLQQLPQTTTSVPQSGTQTTQVSKADISTGIKKHIDSGRKKSSDKKFHVNYRGKDLALDLIRVHDDPLSSLGGGKYFACVDMKATDDTIYDIDFFIPAPPASMRAPETSVHKVNANP